MTNTKNAKDLYWQSEIRKQIFTEFAIFLKEENLERTPFSAQVFAIKKRNTGYDDLTERDLILLIADDLPYMYD